MSQECPESEVWGLLNAVFGALGVWKAIDLVWPIVRHIKITWE